VITVCALPLLINVGIDMLQPSIADYQADTGITLDTWIGPNPIQRTA
jgi:hypothetical protein